MDARTNNKRIAEAATYKLGIIAGLKMANALALSQVTHFTTAAEKKTAMQVAEKIHDMKEAAEAL